MGGLHMDYVARDPDYVRWAKRRTERESRGRAVAASRRAGVALKYVNVDDLRVLGSSASESTVASYSLPAPLPLQVDMLHPCFYSVSARFLSRSLSMEPPRSLGRVRGPREDDSGRRGSMRRHWD